MPIATPSQKGDPYPPPQMPWTYIWYAMASPAKSKKLEAIISTAPNLSLQTAKT
jgi:hypothetical protein